MSSTITRHPMVYSDDESTSASPSLILPPTLGKLKPKRQLSLQIPPSSPSSLSSFSNSTSTCTSSDSPAPAPMPPPSASSTKRRNLKNLSLPIVTSGSNSVSAQPSPQISLTPNPSTRPRRSTTSAIPLRQHESDEGSIPPYAAGAIEILPHIWLGAEENARDTSGLKERGIGYVLNVAKEVVLADEEIDGVVYLHLPWSHGQTDLVKRGFTDAMKFVDEALARNTGVLIHCQCGISRSATLVIALVMRASRDVSQSYKLGLEEVREGGMHAAYAYVKEKSKCIGPNMSLMYQLLEYERHISSSSLSATSSSISHPTTSDDDDDEEQQWSLQRQAALFNSSPPARDDDEMEGPTIEIAEAKELDQRMVDRLKLKKSSSSLSSIKSTPSLSRLNVGLNLSATNNGGGLRVRGERRERASSVVTFTSSLSVESLMEVDEEEEDEELIPPPLVHSSRTPFLSSQQKKRPAPLHLQLPFRPTPPQSARLLKSPSLPSLSVSHSSNAMPHPAQTLFIFPPSPHRPGANQNTAIPPTPSTFTLHTNAPLPLPSTPMMTSKKDKRNSWRSGLAPVNGSSATTASCRVDVRGYVGTGRW